MLIFSRRTRGARLTVELIAAGMLLSGCANRDYRLVRRGDHQLLLPPGLKQAAASEAPQECPNRDEINAMALTGRGAHFGRYGCYGQSGYLDLEPGLRLRVTTPVVPEGESFKSETAGGNLATGLTVRSNTMGWETAFYDVKGHGADSAVELSFVSGEQVIEGERRELSSAIRSKLDLPVAPSHLRLYFLSRRSPDDRNITLLSSREPIGGNEIVELCGSNGVSCLEALPGRSISPYVLVRFNGKEIAAPLGASLSEVLRREGISEPNRALARLNLRRQWRGGFRNVAFEAGDNAILSLPLNAGDEIRIDQP